MFKAYCLRSQQWAIYCIAYRYVDIFLYIYKYIKRTNVDCILTWTTFDTSGPKVVLSMWVGDQLVQVWIIALEPWAGVLTHPIILEGPTGLQHKHQSSSAPRPKHSPFLMITLHSSIPALAKFSKLLREREQTLVLKALPNKRFNQQLCVFLVLKQKHNF